MTQQVLAERVNVTAQAISKWEHGVNQPDLAMVQSLCAVFNVSVDEFLALAREDGDAVEPVEPMEAPLPEAPQESAPSAEKPAAENSGAVAVVKKGKGDYPWYFVAGALALSILAFIITAVLVFGGNRKLTAQQIYARVNPSVFYIEVETKSGRQGGSGFFIDSKGTAVTNYHVIKDGISASITTSDGRQYDVEKVLGANENRDLAVLKIDIPASRGVSFAYSVKTGETVYTIGYPESFLLGTEDSTFTNGIVSKASYDVDGFEYIQTNADITHGNSGGVLINAKGKVIGITTGQLNVGGAGYMNLAIPSSAIKNVRRDVNMTLKEFFSEERPPAPKEFVVTFYDGTRQVDVRRVEEGGTVTAPANSYTGYTFKGWYADKELTKPFNFSAPITKDTSVYGDFTPITYSVSYHANGGTGSMERRTVKYGETFTLADCAFTYTRWTFDKWETTIGSATRQYQAGERVSSLATEEGAEVVFKAVWAPWRYTIFYDVAGGNALASKTLTIGESLSLPRPTRTGYTFVHWMYNGNTYAAGQSVSDLDPTFTLSEITLTAVWTPITFTVRYHSESTNLSTDTTVVRTVKFDERAPSGDSIFDKTGYKFYRWTYLVGSVWYSVYEGDFIRAASVQGAVVDFYSDWNPINYYIEYDYDGDGTADYTRKVDYDYSVWVWDNDAPSRTGMTIDHWVLKTSGGQETEYHNGETFKGAETRESASCRLTAVWRPLVYRVVYYIPDATNVVDQVAWGEKYIIRGADTIERTGYTVTGWTNQTHTIEYTIGQEVENLGTYEGASIWLYGVWRAHTYTVKFEAPDADSGEMEEQHFTYDEAQALTPNAFVRSGYYLASWQHGEESYRNGETVKNLTAEDGGVVTLTAVWNQALEGEGTAERPYLITNFDELKKMDDYVHYVTGGVMAYYALTADIDAEGAVLSPIGRAHTSSAGSAVPVAFQGTFDGRGHIIKDVVLTFTAATNSTTCYVGLFAGISGGTVKNLGIVDYSIDLEEGASMNYFQSTYYVGALAGTVMGASVIENVFVSGNIRMVGGSKTVRVGALAGEFAGTMSNCYASGSIYASAQGGSTGGVITTNKLYVGGIVGLVPASSTAAFEYCYANVEISAALTGSSTQINDYLGGFIGFAASDSKVSFRYCFSVGDVIYARSSATGVGRFAGKAENASLLNVYYNAESLLSPNGSERTGIRPAYTDDFKNFAWVKEHLKFSEDIWTAKEGGLPTLLVFEEGRA